MEYAHGCDEGRFQTVALVGCGKRKLTTQAPARDLYTSPLFRMGRLWAEAHCDDWFILSAKWGIISPADETAPYDLTLGQMGVCGRRDWACRVLEQMRSRCLLKPGTVFVWLAGKHYTSELRPLLAAWDHHDPMEGMRVGQRLQWLKREIAGGTGSAYVSRG